MTLASNPNFKSRDLSSVVRFDGKRAYKLRYKLFRGLAKFNREYLFICERRVQRARRYLVRPILPRFFQ